jgi:hypothetical protein
MWILVDELWCIKYKICNTGMYEDSSVKCLLTIWIIIFIVLGVVEEDTKWNWIS